MRAWDYPFERVVVRCNACGREGNYSKASFVKLVGGDTDLPSAMAIVAKDCPKAKRTLMEWDDRCKAYYPDRAALAREEPAEKS